MYRLLQTCDAQPDQYEIYNQNQRVVGYAHLRNGIFTCRMRTGRHDTIKLYRVRLRQGQFVFQSHEERHKHLSYACDAADKYLNSRGNMRRYKVPKQIPQIQFIIQRPSDYVSNDIANGNFTLH